MNRFNQSRDGQGAAAQRNFSFNLAVPPQDRSPRWRF